MKWLCRYTALANRSHSHTASPHLFSRRGLWETTGHLSSYSRPAQKAGMQGKFVISHTGFSEQRAAAGGCESRKARLTARGFPPRMHSKKRYQLQTTEQTRLVPANHSPANHGGAVCWVHTPHPWMWGKGKERMPEEKGRRPGGLAAHSNQLCIRSLSRCALLPPSPPSLTRLVTTTGPTAPSAMPPGGSWRWGPAAPGAPSPATAAAS